MISHKAECSDRYIHT